MDLPGLMKDHAAAASGRIPSRRPGPHAGSAAFLRAVIRRLDRWLRRREGIFEYTAHPDCVLRIAIRPAGIRTVLSDGAQILPGDLIVDLHLWNEHIPQMGERGPDIAWSTIMRQRMRDSFVLLAAWLEAHPERDDIVAVRALTPFVSHGNARAMERISAGYRFEPVARPARYGFLRRLHDLGENLLIWGLVWTYNPGGLRAKRFMRRRYNFWISRRRFLEHYGSSRAGPAKGGAAPQE